MERMIDEAVTFYKIIKQLQKIFSSAAYTILALRNNNILTAWELHGIVYPACALLVNTLQ